MVVATDTALVENLVRARLVLLNNLLELPIKALQSGLYYFV